MLTWIPLALIRSIVIMSQWDIILWELMPVQLFYKYTWSYWVYCTTTRNILYFKLLPVQASNASSLKKVENDDLYNQVQSPRVIQLLIIRGSNFKFRKSSGNRMKFISKSFFLVYRDDGCQIVLQIEWPALMHHRASQMYSYSTGTGEDPQTIPSQARL